FYADGEALYVEDLGSRNGVQVNGQQVRKQRLHGGDVVAMGRISFVVQPRGKQRGLMGLLAGLRSNSAAREPARQLALP
ncbi:MAG: FHA domain-containing protein, partial [Xanthomonadales bacterium]|nr:FHA domain-containing protein [Xanthomonadales bacterium]NIO14392.1 FHA domain-containing protein [Xanthomonadales bacterium]